MRICEYAVRRYGPLRDTGKVILDDFNLIYGNNEDGKTLTIDALVKLLFGKASKEKEFAAIERVEEAPDGYVVITDRNNEQIKFPGKETFSSITGLSAGECSNIFIIRNSDLSIENEKAFYSGVTERLTGLRTRYINNVIEALRSIGKLTPGGRFQDSGDERLKSRIEDANSLIGTIDSLINEYRSKDIDRAEQRIAYLKERLRHLSGELDELNEARLREQYEKGSEALEKLINARDDVQRVKQFNESELQRWRDNDRDIERLNDEHTVSVKELEKQREELREVQKEVKEQEATWKQYEDKKRGLDETIRPLLKQYEEKRAAIPKFESKKKFFGIAGILSGALFGISMVGVLIAPGIFFYITTALMFTLLIISGSLYYLALRTLASVSAEFQRLITEAARYNLDADSLPRMAEKIELFETDYRQTAERLQERRSEMQNLHRRVEHLAQETIPGIEHSIKSCNKEIDSIRDASGEDSLSGYREKLLQKTEHENIIRTQAALLKRDFGERAGPVNGNVEYWREKVNELEQYKDKARNIDYDEREVSRLQIERQSITEELEALEKQRGTIEERMREIERKGNTILQTGDEYIYCHTLTDLTAIRSMLRDFISYHESVRDEVLTAMEIFSAVQEDEQKKIGELFGADRPVSDYYNRITGGKYTQVEYDQTNATIEVVQANGNRLIANKLSGGAYDQLYFAIRLALGWELLKGDTGFFILDDPFIKSDKRRLHEQLNTLRYITEQGWQILYFSAKEEILDALHNETDKNNIKLIDYRRIA